ncbi:MAG: glycosyltransferase family 2 protein [Candidatus Omnitrophota bacterium]
MKETYAGRGCVIIPALNEEMRIGHIVSEARGRGLDCIVIDDGSVDKTRDEAASEGADVIVHRKNHGKGMSLRDGFKRALEGEYDYVITMDGDGQHHPDELEHFIRAAGKNDTDLVIGNRMGNPKDMPLRRRATNWFMSSLISFMAGQSIPDTQCGYRLIKTKVLRAIPLTTDKYEIESEVLIEAARAGFAIKSIPIKSIYRGQKSQIRPFKDTLRFFSFIFRVALKR